VVVVAVEVVAGSSFFFGGSLVVEADSTPWPFKEEIPLDASLPVVVVAKAVPSAAVVL